MPKIKEIFPPIETALELEPEELAPFVLQHLNTGIRINRHNYTSGNSPEFIEYAGEQKEEFPKRLMEAWIWLEREMFLVPRPASVGTDAFIITRRGRKVLEEQDFEFYKKGSLLPSEGLDPILVRKVKPLFIRGDYDTAVFQAFKEVEIRVRDKAGYTTNEIGTSLMRNAFKSGSGPLADTSLEAGEQEAICHLFAGAIGKFKNASSHRDVEYNDPNEVADIIHLANQLLRMCGRV
ncbi:TIGR02391 family protein [Candidatus Poribacteria bacterium]